MQNAHAELLILLCVLAYMVSTIYGLRMKTLPIVVLSTALFVSVFLLPTADSVEIPECWKNYISSLLLRYGVLLTIRR